jgi:hypothetical protein
MLSGANSFKNPAEEAKEILKNAELIREALEQATLFKKSLGLKESEENLQLSLKINKDIIGMRAAVDRIVAQEAECEDLRDKLATLHGEKHIRKTSADDVPELKTVMPPNTQELQITVSIKGSNAVLFPNQTFPSSLPSDARAACNIKIQPT